MGTKDDVVETVPTEQVEKTLKEKIATTRQAIESVEYEELPVGNKEEHDMLNGSSAPEANLERPTLAHHGTKIASSAAQALQFSHIATPELVEGSWMFEPPLKQSEPFV